jgi:hypothetical protein
MKSKYVIFFLLIISCIGCDQIDENEFPEVLSSQAEVISFKVNGDFLLDIDTSSKVISGILAPNADVSNLIPEIKVSRGATIEPESGVAQDFSNPVNYIVVSRDKAFTANYQVRVYSFGMVSFIINGISIPIDYQHKTITQEFLRSENLLGDVSNISPIIKVSEGCAVSPASGEAVDLTGPVTYTITNSEGLEVKYVVAIKLIEDREVFNNFDQNWTTTNNGEKWDATGENLVFTSKGGGWDQRAILNDVTLTGDFQVEVKVRMTQRLASFWPRIGFFVGGSFGNPLNQPNFLFSLDANDVNGSPRYDIVSLHSYFSPWYVVNHQINGLNVREWTILKMEKRGDEIKAFVNDELISTRSIAGVSGNFGLFGENAHGEFEYVSITNF